MTASANVENDQEIDVVNPQPERERRDTQRVSGQKSRGSVGNPKARQEINNTLDKIEYDGLAPKGEFKNLHEQLPVEGEMPKPPQYEYYEVPGPATEGKTGASDRRLVYDRANDKWYYSGNFHAGGKGGQKADWVEITDGPSL